MKRSMAVVLSTAASLVLALSCVAVAGPIEDGLAASGCNDYATALQLLRPLAEQGSAKAQNIIGTMYLHGLGLPKDEAQAVAWWRKAYRHGDRLSGLELAESGHLAREDVVELKRWSIEAANKGDASGEFSLALLYLEGHTLPRDPAEAARWLRKAADQGVAEAQSMLGQLYDRGQGVAADHAQAMAWYRKAAEQGDISAAYELGDIYSNGTGAPRDYAEAAKWYRMAAEQGDDYAVAKLATMYAIGQGVPQDPVRALEWFELTPLLGRDEEKIKADLLARMTADQVAEAKRLADAWTSVITPARATATLPSQFGMFGTHYHCGSSRARTPMTE